MTQSTGTSSTAAEVRYDNVSPQGRCGTNGHLANPVVSTVTGSTVTVPYASGKPFGTLVIRYSKDCDTAWAEVFYNPAQVTDTSFRLDITVVRKGPVHPRVIPWYTTTLQSPAFSGMLAAGSGEGCVYGAAWVTVGGHSGKQVTTPNCNDP